MSVFVQISHPPVGLDTAFSYGLLGLTLPIQSYLLINTFEPHRSGDEQIYLIRNDDIISALVNRDGAIEAARFRKNLPVGHVTQIPISCCKEVKTPFIKVIRPLSSKGHDPSHCDDFVGLTLKVDGHSVAVVRATHPEIPPAPPNMHQVTLEDALATLTQAGKEQDIIYWGNVVRNYIIYIPHFCGQRLKE